MRRIFSPSTKQSVIKFRKERPTGPLLPSLYAKARAGKTSVAVESPARAAMDKAAARVAAAARGAVTTVQREAPKVAQAARSAVSPLSVVGDKLKEAERKRKR